MDSRAIVAALETLVPGARVEAVAAIDQPTVLVGAESLVAVCTALRDAPEFRFAALVDIVGVDMMPRVPRFDVNYSLVATTVVARLRVKVQVDGETPRLPTVVGVWPAAGFLEREVWDLLGVTFDGHPDLRRLLTPDDWTGHPLRKDYPVQIDAPVKVHEPLQMTEEQFRANIRNDRQTRKGGA
ncbi:MAG: NADH-quinone oxidoreductase subunit C [Acidobacteria bacterium]|nr:NADH-quinone oxidoreductase subunit C [Acidobacteriota bacterium]